MSQKDKGKGKGTFSSPNSGKGNNNNGYKSPNNKQQQQHSQSPSTSTSSSTQPQDENKRIKDRSTYMAMNLVGYNVSVTLKNGSIYDGILHSANTTNGNGWTVVLKMARKRDSSATIITTQPIQSFTIEARDFLGLTATGVLFESQSTYQQGYGRGVDGTFQSDTDISGHDGVIRERELTPWVSDDSMGSDLSLEMGGGSGRNWDQFETNEKLFGVKTSWNEDLYTTTIDRTSEGYKSRIKEAERMANEIENKQSTNLHLQEERGHVKGTDFDEEERYSSVIRKAPTTSTPPSSSSGIYVPPAKRNAGAPQSSGSMTKSTSSNKLDEVATTTAKPTAAAAVIASMQKEQQQKEQRERELKEQQQQKQKQQQQQQQQQQNSNTTGSSTNTTPIKITESTTTTTTTSTATAISNTLEKSPSKDLLETKQQIFKESSSNSTNSLKSSNNGTDSPVVSKLRLRERTNSIDHGDLSSPRDGQSPRTMASYHKIRAAIVAEKLRASTEQKSPLFSPLVSDPATLSALSLSSSKPTVSEDTMKEFNEFILTKNSGEPDRKQQIDAWKNFSNQLNLNRSRPSSPLIGPNSPRPGITNNLASLSLGGAPSPRNSGNEIPTTASSTSTSTTTTTASTTTTSTTEEKKDEKKEGSIGTTKLNPNAKAFTPGMSANAPVFTPKSFAKPPAVAAVVSSVGGGDFGQSGDMGRTTITDNNTLINELYFESFKKRQQHPEQPDSVSSFWSDHASPYRPEDGYITPPGATYHMRPPIGVPMGVPMGVPYYPPPPPQMKTIKVYPNQNRSYPPPPANMAQPQYYVAPPPHQFQYVPPMYNPPPPMNPKRYYPNQNTYPPPQPHIMVPPQPQGSPQQPQQQIPSPTSPPPNHNRMMTASPIPYPYPPNQPYPGPPPRVYNPNDPNQGYPYQ